MYCINDMVEERIQVLKQDEKYKDYNDAKINYLARLLVYKYLRYKVSYKTKIMTFEEYSNYIRLESSILFSDLNYKRFRGLKNGYDHLYNEFEKLFKNLNIKDKHDITSACLDYAKDINEFNKLQQYLDLEAIKTYIRFIANRYNNVIYKYELDNYQDQCDYVLSIVGRNKQLGK